MLDVCIMKLDNLHFALLVAIVLLAVYVARGYGLFREVMDEGTSPYGWPAWSNHVLQH